jgi:hypothetical protein
VQLTDQFCRAAQGQIGPGVGREPVPMAGLSMRVHGNVPVDKGQHLAVALDPQHPIPATHDPAGHAPGWELNFAGAPVTRHQSSIATKAEPITDQIISA